MTSPTQRTLESLRADGWMVQVVEHYSSFSKKRNDLFGCIDVLAVQPGHSVLGVQTTTAANQAARLKKALALSQLKTWLESGCRFQVHGWALRGKRGERKRWTVLVREVTLRDLEPPLKAGAGATTCNVS